MTLRIFLVTSRRQLETTFTRTRFCLHVPSPSLHHDAFKAPRRCPDASTGASLAHGNTWEQWKTRRQRRRRRRRRRRDRCNASDTCVAEFMDCQRTISLPARVGDFKRTRENISQASDRPDQTDQPKSPDQTGTSKEPDTDRPKCAYA